MSDTAPSLRAHLAAITVLATAFVLFASAGLVTLTTAVREAGASVASAFESVRLAEGAEIDLLLHSRTDEPLVRQEIEGDLRRKMSEAHRFVTTDAEAAILASALSRLDAYLAASAMPEVPPGELASRLELSYRELDRYVETNVAQAHAAEDAAVRWDELAKTMGLALGAMLILGAAGLVWWLDARAFGPITDVARTMERFGRGDHTARAREAGPIEVRHIGRQFNEIAATLAAQRGAQMTFLAGVAHDLRNPLSALRMSVRMIRPGQPLPPEPRLRRTFELIDRQITHIDRMVGDLLDTAKIEAGELDLRTEACDASQIVRDVAQLFEATSPTHPIQLTVPDRPIVLRCDPLRIEQVVTNLVSNATKYSPSGGAIEIAVSIDAGCAVLVVRDHGIGISESDQHRLFEPFRRMGTSQQAIPGVGVGLHVVRRIVEAHEGRIEVESALGEGSTFRVWLPITGPADRRPPS